MSNALQLPPRQDSRIDRLTQQLSLINRLGQYTTTLHDREQLFRQITRVIYETLGYDHIQLLLINRRGEAELVHASGAFGESLLRHGFSAPVGGRGIIGWVTGSGKMWVSNNVAHDPHYQPHWLLPNTAAEAALPLRLGERVIGVLDVQSDRPDAFDADDLLLLRTIVNQIAPALEYHRLLADERHERILATTLSDVSRIVCSSLDRDQVLDLILQQIGRVVPHDGTRITLRGEGRMLRVAAAKGYPDNAMARRSAFLIDDAPLSAPVLLEQRTLVIDDARQDSRWFWQPGAEQVRSWCAAPLVSKGVCIGWLCVDRLEPGFYSEEHARIVRAFADQAATAIENARLYAEVKDLSEQLEQKVLRRTAELQLARDDVAAKAAQLSALVRRVVQVQETERQRIAHDLHDGATQTILGAIYELHALRRRLPASAAPRLDASVALLDTTITEMKRIIYALRPRALDELGLVGALDHYAATLRCHNTITTSITVSGKPRPLPDAVELAVYRIVQESTHNSVRHANASRIEIGVAFAPHGLRVMVADNGRGFVPGTPGDGLGLVGMHERALALGARLSLDSRPGAGCRILFEMEWAS